MDKAVKTSRTKLFKIKPLLCVFIKYIFLFIIATPLCNADDIKLLDGHIYKNIKIVKRKVYGIAIEHDCGCSFIYYAKMTQKQKAKYGYDKNKYRIYVENRKKRQAIALKRRVELKQKPKEKQQDGRVKLKQQPKEKQQDELIASRAMKTANRYFLIAKNKRIPNKKRYENAEKALSSLSIKSVSSIVYKLSLPTKQKFTSLKSKIIDLKSTLSKSSLLNKNFPLKLAAYVLHSRYLFSAAGHSSGWYYGKKVTISGVVDINQIKQITSYSNLGEAYCGKYKIPMLNGEIICLSVDKPSFKNIQGYPVAFASNNDKKEKRKNIEIKYSSNNTINKKYLVIKCQGIVKRCLDYKTAILDDVNIISIRRIKAQRSNLKSRYNKSQKKYYHAKNSYVSDELNFYCWIRIKFANLGISSRLCLIGNDPDAYVEEFLYARKIVKKYFRGLHEEVGVDGLLINNTDDSDLEKCQITSWEITAHCRRR